MILAALAEDVASMSFSTSSSDENSNMPPPAPAPPRLRSALDDRAKSNSCRAIRDPNAGSKGMEQVRHYISLKTGALAVFPSPSPTDKVYTVHVHK